MFGEADLVAGELGQGQVCDPVIFPAGQDDS
jgi:hypothetical protein